MGAQQRFEKLLMMLNGKVGSGCAGRSALPSRGSKNNGQGFCNGSHGCPGGKHPLGVVETQGSALHCQKRGEGLGQSSRKGGNKGAYVDV